MTKIDIYSGFLGAGKTTLIKKMIAEAYQGEKLVLIENEFGEIGIDGGFLQDAGIEITEMNSGCFCCSLVGDFGRALEQVIAKFSPDRILIEPSGVGKLSDVIAAVRNVHAPDAKLTHFVTVADATKCKIYMKNFGEFYNNQIESAGTIILSRTDKISEEKMAQCLQLLRSHNPDATIVTTPWDQLTGSQILEAMDHKNALAGDLQNMAKEACPAGGHGHEDACGCGHDHPAQEDACGCGHDHHHHGHHHADEVFTSWGIETAKKFSTAGLQEILEELDDCGTYGQILRAKGFVAGEDGQWIYFDYVPGETDIRSGSPAVTGRVCVIGSQMKEDAIAALFGA